MSLNSEQQKKKLMERAAGFTSIEELIKLMKDIATAFLNAPVFQVIIGIVIIDRLNQTFVEVTDERGNVSKQPLMATIDASRLKIVLISGPVIIAISQGLGAFAAAKSAGGT